MKKTKKITALCLSLFIAGAFVFLITSNCLAADSLVDTGADTPYATGNYTLADIRGYAIYLMRLILSLVGILSLLAFIYGGITILISAGRSDQVKQGTNAIKAAVVGLLITFSSILIINLFVKTIGANWDVQTGAITTTKTGK